MSSGRKQYPFHLIEAKWQEYWHRQQTFRAWDPSETPPKEHPYAQRHSTLPPKFYILDMFPYPSGAGLHAGHPEGYTATDILARFQRMRGYNVLHPIGWDAFGLPAEQYAIKTGQHPRITTEANIGTFKRQIQSLGFSYDWSREVDTTDPEYYQWTQWIFLQIYNSWFNPETNRAEPIDTLPYPDSLKTEEERRAYRDGNRLAYVAEAPVNWCPELGTVLANEEVQDGKSEVGGFPVIRKPMRQWMLRITAYSERLLCDLDLLDWPESLKEMQRNWIGRSEGADITFPIAEQDETLTVFTTRPDTLFGASYMVLAPEHPLVDRLTSDEQREEVEEYKAYAAGKSDLERTDLAKEKTGVWIGSYAVNPVNQEHLPIWIADYVLASYGTGAIMAVPGHDTRDLEFARTYSLPIKKVVQAPEGQESIGFTGEGINVNSGILDGLPTRKAKERIIQWLEEHGAGKRSINYKLRDWLFSRQRYWGEPFPIVWKNNHHEAVPETELPVMPPDLPDFKPTESGEPPLARATDWVNLPDGSRRETNTMPQWAGSCWYYLRYIDPTNQKSFLDKEREGYWMGTSDLAKGQSKDLASHPGPGVDLYIGGTEHAVLHLLYARFWHKILFDLRHVSTPEPFHRLVNQGIILGEDGQKMSKSRGNVINPDDIISEFGADSFRLYEMFMGPLELTKPWSTKGVEGVYRFLGRVWRLFIDESSDQAFHERLTASSEAGPDILNCLRIRNDIQDKEPTTEQLKVLHSCIRKVTEDIEGLRMNTAISALMVFVNDALRWETKPVAVMTEFLLLLHPFAPHVAEELYARLTVGQTPQHQTIAYHRWPAYDPARLVESTVEIPVQVNGKLRDKLTVPMNTAKAELEEKALSSEKVQPFLKDKTIKKVVVVPNKVVNIAVA